jgi:hypothetical protein
MGIKQGANSEQNKDQQVKENRRVADRFFVSRLGEPYYDALKIEAWLKGRTMAAEGNSLLCARLMQREDYRKTMLERCARKRGISVDELWDLILQDRARPFEAQDYAEWAEWAEEPPAEGS